MAYIDTYVFGRMHIDGQVYTTDLKLFPGTVQNNWWREEGHLLQTSDISDVLAERPELLIIGQGAQSRMQLSEEVIAELQRQSISYIAYDTHTAADVFNQYVSQQKHVIGVFHLTC